MVWQCVVGVAVVNFRQRLVSISGPTLVHYLQIAGNLCVSCALLLGNHESGIIDRMFTSCGTPTLTIDTNRKQHSSTSLAVGPQTKPASVHPWCPCCSSKREFHLNHTRFIHYFTCGTYAPPISLPITPPNSDELLVQPQIFYVQSSIHHPWGADHDLQ